MPSEQVLVDCSTQDLERLRPTINQLSLDFQGLQHQAVGEMDVRDQIIVLIASLEQLGISAERAAKQTGTPRFVRSIKTAYRVARSFGTGRAQTVGGPTN